MAQVRSFGAVGQEDRRGRRGDPVAGTDHRLPGHVYEGRPAVRLPWRCGLATPWKLWRSRTKGLVWHTTRHEFVSRHAENTGDPVLTQHLARHKDLRTTQAYFHVRNSRVLKAAVRLNR